MKCWSSLLGLLSFIASKLTFTFSFTHSDHQHSGWLLFRPESAFRSFQFQPPPLALASIHQQHHHICRHPTRPLSHIALPSSSSSLSFRSSSDTPSVIITIKTLVTCTIDRVIMSSPITIVTYDILSKQNATTTNAIIEHYTSESSSKSNSDAFLGLSESEGSSILRRDDEDGSKLQKGIDVAKAKGVLDPKFVPEEYISIDVLGKSPEDVANEILYFVRQDGDGGQGGGGGVVVLCGLSGTGKGTTVAALREKLVKEDGKRVVCWSNGNIFRSVTLLAVTWCEEERRRRRRNVVENVDDIDIDEALTKENLASFMGMLEFGKFNGKFDIKINGLGLELLVSEVENTELKSPKVSKNIPTVAEATQGEVIHFASDAIMKLVDDGIFVLLEGREQTVNYVRTPLRFILTLSDASLIGKRRAAQRLAAGALEGVRVGANPEEIIMALDGQLARMMKEIHPVGYA